jgi:hypothetical protein
MVSKSILLKVSPEAHAGIQEAAGRHQRSMQVVLVALIERWLAAGGPDPLQFDMGQPAAAPSSGEVVDREARRAIKALVERVGDLQDQVLALEAREDQDWPGWAERVVSTLQLGAEHRGAPRTSVAHLAQAERQLMDGVFGQPPRVKTPPHETGESLLSSSLSEQQGRGSISAVALDRGS